MKESYPQTLFGKIIESEKKIFGVKKDQKILKTKSKIHIYFRVVHSIIPLLTMGQLGSSLVTMYVKYCEIFNRPGVAGAVL